MTTTTNEEKIYQKALNFATLRPRSEKEIQDWFRRKSIDQEYSEKALKQLKKLRLIDDRTFAKWWIDSRVSFKFYSRQLLQFELKQKGVDQKIIESALRKPELPPEIDLAKKALSKKIRNKVSFSSEEKRKLYSYLARRGFSWSTIKRAVDELGAEE